MAPSRITSLNSFINNYEEIPENKRDKILEKILTKRAWDGWGYAPNTNISIGLSRGNYLVIAYDKNGYPPEIYCDENLNTIVRNHRPIIEKVGKGKFIRDLDWTNISYGKWEAYRLSIIIDLSDKKPKVIYLQDRKYFSEEDLLKSLRFNMDKRIERSLSSYWD